MAELNGKLNLVSLKEYIESLIAGLEKAVDQRLNDFMKLVQLRFDLNAEALDKAYARMDQRLEGMNELRAQLNRYEGSLVTKEMLETRLNAIETNIKGLEHFKSMLEGKADAGAVRVSYVIASIGLAISAIGIIIAVMSLVR